ncbi:MAG: hypothetical protein ABSC57_10825, partial [Syntrophales bacterium]
ILSKDTIDGIRKRLKDLKNDGLLTREAILRIEKCINVEIYSNWDARHPAQYAMMATKSFRQTKKDLPGPYIIKKKDGPKTNWSKNFLIYSLLQDVHYYGNRVRKYYSEIGDFLEYFEGDEEKIFTDDNIRKTYKLIRSSDIFKLVKLCYQWSFKTEIEFLPVDIVISEIPNNFLTILSHRAGFKLSPYLATAGRSGKPLPSSVKSYRK